MTAVWDNNYQFIPYASIVPPATPREYLKDALFANSYRIKAHGFKFKVMEIQNRQAHNSSSGTEILTTFIKDIPVQLWSDPNNIWRLENVLPRIAGDNLYDVNNNFQTPKPTSMEMATLKNAVIDLGKE